MILTTNIKIERFINPELEEQYIAILEDRPGVMETGKTIGDALRKLSISIDILEDYLKKPII